jgi:multicomponent Na+:H+ antiporter subunit E
MRMFLWNLLLALGWMMLMGRFEPADLLVGFGLSYLVLFTMRRVLEPTSYFSKVPEAIGFVAFFVKELVLANMRVAYDVITPTHLMRPGVVAIPLDAKTDAEITVFANLLTLTPGTMSLDVSADRSVLYIHAMYIDDIEELRRQIKEGFERRTTEILR